MKLELPVKTVAENQSTKIKAIGFYSDGSERVLKSEAITWSVSGSVVASIDDFGILTGLVRGVTRVWASYEGITESISITVTTGLLPCGGQVNDTDMYNAAGYCLKVIEGDSGEAKNKLFTATPSIEVMNQLGYKLEDSATNFGRTYGATYQETRIEGEFARFRVDGWSWENDPQSSNFGRNGQLDRYCDDLNSLRFMGRTNWKRPNRYELYSLVYHLGDLTANYGWPGYYEYWTNHPTKDGKFYSVDLVNNLTIPHSVRMKSYASCVSYNN
ncbi:hypothetical protein VIBNISOn1_350004 [Vibrio nigripulchritudo SOn1]|uniref:BIG2 domain-containing protein n=1 Tax=Vibrio nigripulchritudo SOn1 TaxID=1238450 RepID=A0AAV2VSU0_9VIBR|nr:hypothetical protein VIBNISOn1_350004 [Vibrio nigripulchritudo SOn1]